MSPNEFSHHLSAEFRRMNFRRTRLPPFRRALAVMETDSAKLPCITKHERSGFLPEHEMIVFLRLKVSGLDAEISAHAEVDSEPVLI